VQIKVADVELRIEDQLSRTDEVKRFASDADNIAVTVVSIDVRTVSVHSAHAVCHSNHRRHWTVLMHGQFTDITRCSLARNLLYTVYALMYVTS